MDLQGNGVYWFGEEEILFEDLDLCFRSLMRWLSARIGWLLSILGPEYRITSLIRSRISVL